MKREDDASDELARDADGLRDLGGLAGAVGDGAPHGHFAAQAVMAPEPVIVEHQGGVAAGRCILIEPLVPHRLAPAPHARLVYVEPALRVPAGLLDAVQPIWAQPAPLVVGGSQARSFWATLRAAPPATDRPPDARITAALAHLDDALPLGPVPLDEAARAARLSPDRFRHLFAAEMGLAYRRYVLWRRLRLAIVELQAGRDVTTAAHAAGFADAAHFARTLKSTFGVTATQARIGR